jgi:hypothetical protein
MALSPAFRPWVDMNFTADGKISSKGLVTDIEPVASYRALRDLAIENSSTEPVTA